MASVGIQMLGSALSLLGWMGVIMTCVLPMWRVTAFIGATIITSQTIWEGIWMSCVVESTGQIQCKPYDSLLALSSDLQAARALTILAIATGAAGLLLAFVGGKCTRFLDEQGGGVKDRVAVAAGTVLIATGLLCLIPTSWAAGVVVQGFYSSTTDAQRREIGACLYIGWGASILLILGGGLFISASFPLRAHDEDKRPSVRYLVVRSSNGAASSQAAASQRSRGSSTKSQPNGKMAFTRSHSSQAASAKSQPRGVVNTRPPWEEEGLGGVEQGYRPESGGSKAPSTKSQLKRLESQESLADKSQPGEDESSNPTKTYL
ncbi:claudin-4 [Coregonus clupeaformis]|uniref:claudin-4 n=1 Tax=Coregonus clupeaformis TaxID=59861 RepID=UPI001BE05AD3|nr:claudin-4 [Coregonus clupeaformis]